MLNDRWIGRINYSFSLGFFYLKFVFFLRKKGIICEMYIILLNLGDVICYY